MGRATRRCAADGGDDEEVHVSFPVGRGCFDGAADRSETKRLRETCTPRTFAVGMGRAMESRPEEPAQVSFLTFEIFCVERMDPGDRWSRVGTSWSF